MAFLQERILFDAPDLRVFRVSCDGRDPPRPVEERVAGDRVVLPVRGRFLFRSSAGTAVASPMRALFLRSGESFEVRHPQDSGDVSLSIGGAVASRLVAEGRPSRRVRPEEFAFLYRLLASGTDDSSLRIEQAVREALDPVFDGGSTRPRDVEIASTIALEIEASFWDPGLRLSRLAAAAGVSASHACRAFRRVRKTTVHAYVLEARLQHALALVLDSELPLARIAFDCGFSSQGHFGNAFRERYGCSPGGVRGGSPVGRRLPAPPSSGPRPVESKEMQDT